VGNTRFVRHAEALAGALVEAHHVLAWAAHTTPREEETFRRLRRLHELGYVREDTDTDAIFLKSPSDGPPLIFYEDGAIVSLKRPINPRAESDRDRIPNSCQADRHTFDLFIASVKKPSAWQRGAADREKYLWQPGCLLLMFGGWLILVKGAAMVWSALTN
jgi:hypothetical protein